jgi:hypothetical protein
MSSGLFLPPGFGDDMPSDNLGTLIPVTPMEKHKARQVLERIAKQIGDDSSRGRKMVDRDAFARNVIERFAEEASLVVTVSWKPNHYQPEAPELHITVVDRLEGPFDHEQAAWEVTHGVDGGEGGVIKTGLTPESAEEIMSDPKERERFRPE